MTRYQHLETELADTKSHLDEALRDNLTLQDMFWVVAIAGGFAGFSITISAQHILGVL